MVAARVCAGSLESSEPFEVSTDGQRSRVDPHGTQFVDENGVTLRGWIDSEDLTLWEPDARVQLAVGNAETWIVACRREPAPVQGTRRLQRVRLFPRSFVLYRPWIQANIVEECVLLCALLHIFVGLKRTRDQKLASGLMSGQLSSAITG